MILLLDTTVLIDVLRGRKQRRAFLEDLVLGGHTLSTSAMNVGEVYSGIRSGEEARTELFLRGLECISVTKAIAQRAGELRRVKPSQGWTVALADMIVAATAIDHGMTLLTDNEKDFVLPGLELLTMP